MMLNMMLGLYLLAAVAAQKSPDEDAFMEFYANVIEKVTSKKSLRASTSKTLRIVIAPQDYNNDGNDKHFKCPMFDTSSGVPVALPFCSLALKTDKVTAKCYQGTFSGWNWNTNWNDQTPAVGVFYDGTKFIKQANSQVRYAFDVATTSTTGANYGPNDRAPIHKCGTTGTAVTPCFGNGMISIQNVVDGTPTGGWVTVGQLEAVIARRWTTAVDGFSGLQVIFNANAYSATTGINPGYLSISPVGPGEDGVSGNIRFWDGASSVTSVNYFGVSIGTSDVVIIQHTINGPEIAGNW